MMLYHGTRAGLLPQVLEHGLHPRGSSLGNWHATVKSNSRAVYLTTGYALYFAQAAVGDYPDDLLILEVDTHDLEHEWLAPDEDFLEQAARHSPDFAYMQEWSMEERTLWFRHRARRDFGHYWEYSLRGMGTCCYFQVVPPRAITRYATVPRDSPVIFQSDPTITIMNYQVMGGHYRQLTRYVFGEAVDQEDLVPFTVPALKWHEDTLPRAGIHVCDLREETA